jgi:ankyrin repeat protein
MTTVKIPDAALRRALESNGATPEGTSVDAAKLSCLGHIDWSEDGVGEADPSWFARVADLRGLEHAVQLRVLGLGGNALRDLGPLAGHPALEELWLHDNELLDISALASIPRLRIAVLDANRSLVDIRALAAASSLTYVNITHTKVADLTPLDGLTRLTKLSFYGLHVGADSPSFETLVKLGLRGCELLGEASLLLEVRKEIDRRKALEATARRTELMTESSGDGLLQALLAAGLDEMASHCADRGARGRDALGRTLLHLLAAANVDEAVRAKLTRELVAAGTDLNAVQLCAPATSALGVSVAKARSAEYLSLLLELGADPNAGRSRPPLLLAVESADASRIDLLLAAGADLRPAFARIIESGAVDLVKRAIAAAPDLPRTEHLVQAVKRKSEAVVSALLEAGVDPNAPTLQDAPVLHYVESAAMFDLLLAAGADLHARNSLGATPLLAYVQLAWRSPELAATLVRRAAHAGASMHVHSKLDGGPIHVLAQSRAPGAEALVPVLAELGAVLDGWVPGGAITAFDRAASAPMKAALKAAKVGTGKSMATRLAKQLTSLESGDAAAWAAAKKLAGSGQAKLLAPFARLLSEKLLALGEPLASAFEGFGSTSELAVTLLEGGVDGVSAKGAPLLHAVITSMEFAEPARQAAVAALLAAGANADALDVMGTPALNLYLDFTKVWDVALVAELATDAAVRPAIERTALAIALSWATRADATPVIDLLLERGSDLSRVVGAASYGGRLDVVRRAVEARAAIPESALHSAVHANAVDVAAYLLARGVDPNRGATVRPLIVDVSSVEMLDLLIAHGADPFVVTSDGETPLHLVVRKGMPAPRFIALIERLEGLGISRSVPDARKNTALATLQARAEPEIQAFLTKA